MMGNGILGTGCPSVSCEVAVNIGNEQGMKVVCYQHVKPDGERINPAGSWPSWTIRKAACSVTGCRFVPGSDAETETSRSVTDTCALLVRRPYYRRP